MYQFKQAVCVLKKDYSRGVHEVPEAAETNPVFLKYVQLGLIVEADVSKVITQASLQDRAKKLHAKLLKKKPDVSPDALPLPPEHPIDAMKAKEQAQFGKAEEVLAVTSEGPVEPPSVPVETEKKKNKKG